MIRDYRLIEFFEDGRLASYNLRNDLSEERNLVNEEPAIAARLHQILVDWRLAVEAKIPPSNPAYTER